MRLDEPLIFNITQRMRQSYIAITSDSVDLANAKHMNLKILQFVLRCQMSDIRLYHVPCGKLVIDEDLQRARINFARLYKQCDVMAILPRPEPGIVRYTLPLNPFPLPKSVRKATQSTFRRQLAIVVAKVSEISANFAIYSSNFGIQLTVSLPTISVILPGLDTDSSREIMSYLRSIYSPFDYDSFIVRFAIGNVRAAGRIWHYRQLPPGSSMSPNETLCCTNAQCVCLRDELTEEDQEELAAIRVASAGSLGCYCILSEDEEHRYAITAGHVAHPNPRHFSNEVLAPASKPFVEAVKSTTMDLNQTIKAEFDATVQRERVEKLTQLNRLFGETILSSTRTEEQAPYRKIDYALVKVLNDRYGDNRMDKLQAYREEFDFRPSGVHPILLERKLAYADTVYKLGAQTGLTKGCVINDAKVRWNPESTDPLPEDDTSVPVSDAYAVLGTPLANGSFETFAEPGDSGSMLVRLTRDPTNHVSLTEAAGIVYGIVWEEPHQAHVGLYIPLNDVIKHIKTTTGQTVNISVPDIGQAGLAWNYEELGKGKSMYDLK
jgi:hypothetical protein